MCVKLLKKKTIEVMKRMIKTLTEKEKCNPATQIVGVREEQGEYTSVESEFTLSHGCDKLWRPTLECSPSAGLGALSTEQLFRLPNEAGLGRAAPWPWTYQSVCSGQRQPGFSLKQQARRPPHGPASFAKKT